MAPSWNNQGFLIATEVIIKLLSQEVQTRYIKSVKFPFMFCCMFTLKNLQRASEITDSPAGIPLIALLLVCRRNMNCKETLTVAVGLHFTTQHHHNIIKMHHFILYVWVFHHSSAADGARVMMVPSLSVPNPHNVVSIGGEKSSVFVSVWG